MEEMKVERRFKMLGHVKFYELYVGNVYAGIEINGFMEIYQPDTETIVVDPPEGIIPYMYRNLSPRQLAKVDDARRMIESVLTEPIRR